jgi:hypothetical protein
VRYHLVAITKNIPCRHTLGKGTAVPPQNPALIRATCLPPRVFAETCQIIHPVLCALGRRQTNAMTSRCTSRSAPTRFRWILLRHTYSLASSSPICLFDGQISPPPAFSKEFILCNEPFTNHCKLGGPRSKQINYLSTRLTPPLVMR